MGDYAVKGGDGNNYFILENNRIRTPAIRCLVATEKDYPHTPTFFVIPRK
jgi:hypothetical protein